MNPLFIGPIIDVVGKIIDRIVPDKAAAEKAKMDLLAESTRQEFGLALEQVRVNAEEAKHPSVFVAGWRPFIGWVCGVAVAYNFVLYPLLLWGVAAFQITIDPPELFEGSLMELVMGMLGLAGLRTWEKFKDVARTN